MVQPVRPWPYRFLRKKEWGRLDSNLRVHYGIASPSGSQQLGASKLRQSLPRSFSSLQASEVATRGLRHLNLFSMAIFQRETSAHIGEGLTCEKKNLCEAVISGSLVQLLQASLAAGTTGGRFQQHFGPNMTLEAILECLIFLGEHAPRPLLKLCVAHPSSQWPFQSKIAGSSPGVTQCANVPSLKQTPDTVHGKHELSRIM